MHATHQFFMTQRSLYVLVLNNREGEAESDADYWLKLIESFADDSPIIIVLNKIQGNPFDINRRALLNKYPAIKAVIATDCKEAIGIDELRKAIERATDRLAHLRDAFPASWFAIKDRLALMGARQENYLTFEDYRKTCCENR
jgi:internalin A